MGIREPVQPVDLARARISVDVAIDECFMAPQGQERLCSAIKTWHARVQAWQDSDTLNDAFLEGRLHHRAMNNRGRENYDFGDKNQGRRDLLRKINNDDYPKPVNKLAMKNEQGVWVSDEELETRKGTTILLDAGVSGISRRLDPRNFFPRGDGDRPQQSSKFLLGLHDLSGSLLDPDGFELKTYSDSHFIALMPLPLPQDVALFYELRRLSKTPQATAGFKGVVAILASEFTRPKLASEGDMGAVYVLKTSERHGGQSVKYVKGSGTAVTSKDSPLICNLNASRDYRRVLTGRGIANEVTVAYRKCGHKGRFPVFVFTGGKWAKEKYYKEVAITLPTVADGFADYKETGWLVDKKTYEVVNKS